MRRTLEAISTEEKPPDMVLERRTAPAIGRVLLVASTVALGGSSVWTALTLRQGFVLPIGPWQPPSAFTPGAVAAHVALVVLSLAMMLAASISRPASTQPGWVNTATLAWALGITVALILIVSLLIILGSDSIQDGPIGDAMTESPPPKDARAEVIYHVTAFGTFVVLLAFYGVHLVRSLQGKSMRSVLLFSVSACVVLGALGTVFPVAYTLMARDSLRDTAIFQDMIRIAGSIPEGSLPQSQIGTTSGAEITAKRWVQAEPATLPPSLIMCVIEPLSVPATYSPWTRVGLQGGVIGGLVPDQAENCFTVRPD